MGNKRISPSVLFLRLLQRNILYPLLILLVGGILACFSHKIFGVPVWKADVIMCFVSMVAGIVILIESLDATCQAMKRGTESIESAVRKAARDSSEAVQEWMEYHCRWIRWEKILVLIWSSILVGIALALISIARPLGGVL